MTLSKQTSGRITIEVREIKPQTKSTTQMKAKAAVDGDGGSDFSTFDGDGSD
ncbi:MAG: hypothetical protein HC936_03725 [Leptolyngbyaceae cyanobacterium SU_3_3]|nr:hypothetical protein [Leptolyngbyaceae cyanobacterium SU_3_3]